MGMIYFYVITNSAYTCAHGTIALRVVLYYWIFYGGGMVRLRCGSAWTRFRERKAARAFASFASASKQLPHSPLDDFLASRYSSEECSIRTAFGSFGGIRARSKNPLSAGSAKALREACRRGEQVKPTSGLAPGYVQCNVVILPASTRSTFLYLRFGIRGLARCWEWPRRAARTILRTSPKVPTSAQISRGTPCSKRGSWLTSRTTYATSGTTKWLHFSSDAPFRGKMNSWIVDSRPATSTWASTSRCTKRISKIFLRAPLRETWSYQCDRTLPRRLPASLMSRQRILPRMEDPCTTATLQNWPLVRGSSPSALGRRSGVRSYRGRPLLLGVWGDTAGGHRWCKAAPRYFSRSRAHVCRRFKKWKPRVPIARRSALQRSLPSAPRLAHAPARKENVM